MTPGPSLQELIATIHADAASEDPLEQLMTASQIVAELQETGDAVLGHFVDVCRRNGHSWTEISGSLGVTKQAAHKRFSFWKPNLERFTERARTALRAASGDARSLGHNYVGTEHLLLGLFEPSGGIAAVVLGEAGITRARVEERILAVVPRGGTAIGSDVKLPFTPRAVASLERTLTEALSLGHNYIGTEHLLLGLFGETGSLATRVLTESGVSHDLVRAQVIEKLSGFASPTT
jgi:predicted component of type VI protein secretion system